MSNENYTRLADFLSKSSREQFHEALSEPWMNEICPGLNRLPGCDQGRNNHLEGDAAVHSAMVFEAMTLVAQRRLGRMPDFIELLSALVHDLKKPDSRRDDGCGGVSFPDHERLAAIEVPAISRRLGLGPEEEARFHFLIERHGDANSFLRLPEEVQAELKASPFVESLAVLQEADALSCVKPGGAHGIVYWEQLMGLEDPEKES